MLGLRQQVGCDPGGVGRVISDDNGFCGTCQTVNPHHAENLFLGKRDEEIAGTEDLIHRADGFGTISQCSDGLCPTHRVDFVHANERGGGKDDGCDLTRPTLRRDSQHDLLHARHLGRHSGHQHTRRKRSRPAGDVQPDTLDRTDQLPHHAAHLLRDP